MHYQGHCILAFLLNAQVIFTLYGLGLEQNNFYLTFVFIAPNTGNSDKTETLRSTMKYCFQACSC